MIPVPAVQPIAIRFTSYYIRPKYFLLCTMDIILQHFTQIALPSILLRSARGTLRKFYFFRGTLELEDKVNLSLSSHWGHRGGAEVLIVSFLNSAIDGSERSNSHLACCTAGINTYGPPNRRLSGHQGRSGRFWEEKNLSPLPRIEPRTFEPLA
jgi:hypothetical protein